MRTNSIMSDSINDPTLTVPALSGQAKEKPQPTDYEKIANSSEYPQFVHYLDSRIKHFQQFVPGGKLVEEIDPKELPYRWGQSTAIIQELEALKNTLEAFKKKK